MEDYFRKIIEAVVSTYGADLDREETIQECWLFLVKLIPKIKLKGNISAYAFTCLRNYISDIREVKIKYTYTSLDSIGEIEDKC